MRRETNCVNIYTQYRTAQSHEQQNEKKENATEI